MLEEISEEVRKGKKIILLGDTRDSSSMLDDGQDCDVLVHEATFDKSLPDKAKETGHSTSAMAGEFAKAVGAKNLILTHFSSRYCKSGNSGKSYDYFFKDGGDADDVNSSKGTSLEDDTDITVEQLREEAEEVVNSCTKVFCGK